MSLIKARLFDTALSSYQKFSSDRDLPENIIPFEFKALKHLTKTKNHHLETDKGSTLLILDKFSYISATEEILNSNARHINQIINLEKRITS